MGNTATDALRLYFFLPPSIQAVLLCFVASFAFNVHKENTRLCCCLLGEVEEKKMEMARQNSEVGQSAIRSIAAENEAMLEELESLKRRNQLLERENASIERRPSPQQAAKSSHTKMLDSWHEYRTSSARRSSTRVWQRLPRAELPMRRPKLVAP